MQVRSSPVSKFLFTREVVISFAEPLIKANDLEQFLSTNYVDVFSPITKTWKWLKVTENRGSCRDRALCLDNSHADFSDFS